MNTKFTPGPWKRVDCATHADIISANGHTVAMVAQESDADMIAALPDMYARIQHHVDYCHACGGDGYRSYGNLVNVEKFVCEECADDRAALAKADGHPVAAPSADVARAVIAHMERHLRIVELNPLDVMEMEEQAGIDAAEEPIPDPLTINPLPANGLAYMLGAIEGIAGEGVEE